MTSVPCPLCAFESSHYFEDGRRAYHQCGRCELVFVLPEFFLSEEEERAEYDLHENSPVDSNYRRFLSRVCDPVCERLPVGSRGLDFGCGPGPTLSVMFQERGYPTAVYDPFYAKDETVLDVQYDFVTATEVVEHMRNPAESLERLWKCVKPGGLVGIMTKLVAGKEAFAGWHYKSDLTHISFFSKTTFKWLARQWGTKPIFIWKDVVIIEKRPLTSRADREVML